MKRMRKGGRQGGFRDPELLLSKTFRDPTMENRRVDPLSVCFAVSWRTDMKSVDSRKIEGGWIEELWVLGTIPYRRTSRN